MNNLRGYVENGEYYMPLYGIIKTRNRAVFDTYNRLAETGQLYHIYAYCLELVAGDSSNNPLDKDISSHINTKIDKIISILDNLTDKTIDLDTSLTQTNQQLLYTTEQVSETSVTVKELKTQTMKMVKDEISQIISYLGEGKLSGEVVKELMTAGNSIIVKAVEENKEIQEDLAITEEELKLYKTEEVAQRMEFLGDEELDEEDEDFMEMMDDLLSNFKP